MKIGRRVIFLLSCLCLLLPHLAFAHPPIPWQSRDGLVVGVTEGDRLTVNSFGAEIRVRLYGVATPQPPKIDRTTGWYKPGQPYAEEAFRALSSKVLHQQVRVEIRKTLVNKDEQVALAVVYLDGRNINMEMIAEGWGWVDRRFLSKMDLGHYTAVEKLARAHRDGLWVQEHPQPPWEFKPEFRIRNRHG